MQQTSARSCRLCGSPRTLSVADIHGKLRQRAFELSRCEDCGFVFIADPWTDFARIYDERYYSGAGADPLVDYEFELMHPRRTIRAYEWHGVARCVERLKGRLRDLRWLDFGCGNGGLVRYLNANAGAAAIGYEQGHIAARARAAGIPILDEGELEGRADSFDVITAIEVLEHTLDPIAELRTIRKLLRSGGLLFLTTGNAAPFAERLASWRYIVPEIHISLFDPGTLAHAMREAGLRPEQRPLGPGFDEILKFKTLKNLGIRRRNRVTDLLPARAIAALVERRVRLRDHPVGWKS